MVFPRLQYRWSMWHLKSAAFHKRVQHKGGVFGAGTITVDGISFFFAAPELLGLINAALACAVLKDCECTPTGFLIL